MVPRRLHDIATQTRVQQHLKTVSQRRILVAVRPAVSRPHGRAGTYVAKAAACVSAAALLRLRVTLP